MDIQEEKNAFLNVYVNYKDDFRKIQFNEETEQFMWRKNNVSDTEVEYVHLMNQRWYAWLACAKCKAQKVTVPEGFVLVNKNKSEAFSKKLNDYLDDAWRDGSAFDDGFVSVDEINHDKIWSLVVEAQEQVG